MGTKKIALVIFLLGLILLSIAFVIFATRGSKNNLTSSVLTQPEAQGNIDNQVADNPAKVGPAAMESFTAEQIEEKIEEMRVQINTQSKGRPLTDDELYFLDFPREAAIQALKKSK